MSFDSNLKAGAAMVDITPPLDVPLAGSFGTRYADKILEPLRASAVFLSDGETELGLISLELGEIGDEPIKAIRKLVHERVGIPEENILVAATHAHAGPVVTQSLLGAGEPDPFYNNIMIRKIASALIMAKKNAVPAKVGAGAGHEDTIAFNRRLKVPDGRVLMNFRVEKELVQDAEPLGPIDPEVLVMRVDSLDNRNIAIIVNYALHNCTSGGGIHPDFSGYMAKYLRSILGEDLVVPFFAGPCGNVNHINYRDLNPPRGHEMTHKVARILAGEVLRVHSKISPSTECSLAVASKVLSLSDREFTTADSKLDECMAPNKKHYLKEWAVIKKEGIRENFPVEIQVIRVGDVAIATNPGELFVEFGLEIKEKSPFKHTFVVELANGFAGYIPTQQAFEEGGYEPLRAVHSSHLRVDAGDIIVKETLNLLKRI